MYTIIEPGLKPAPPPPPRGDIFVLYCSHCLQLSCAFSLGREGGRNEPFYSSDVTFAWVKASFKILAILYYMF